MNFKQSQSEEKLRGGYYTPPAIASFLAKWAVSPRPATILEPSCGDGAFIRAVSQSIDYPTVMTGVEWVEAEARKAGRELKASRLIEGNVVHADFLSWAHEAIDKRKCFDCVVGNPPYIRYQYLEKIDQDWANSS